MEVMFAKGCGEDNDYPFGVLDLRGRREEEKCSGRNCVMDLYIYIYLGIVCQLQQVSQSGISRVGLLEA